MLTEDSAEVLSNLYPDDVTSTLAIMESEIATWKSKWSNASPVPRSAVDALNNCNKHFFLNIFQLLRIFATQASPDCQELKLNRGIKCQNLD